MKLIKEILSEAEDKKKKAKPTKGFITIVNGAEMPHDVWDYKFGDEGPKKGPKWTKLLKDEGFLDWQQFESDLKKYGCKIADMGTPALGTVGGGEAGYECHIKIAGPEEGLREMAKEYEDWLAADSEELESMISGKHQEFVNERDIETAKNLVKELRSVAEELSKVVEAPGFDTMVLEVIKGDNPWTLQGTVKKIQETIKDIKDAGKVRK